MSSDITKKPGFLKEINESEKTNNGNPTTLSKNDTEEGSHSPGYLKSVWNTEEFKNRLRNSHYIDIKKRDSKYISNLKPINYR